MAANPFDAISTKTKNPFDAIGDVSANPFSSLAAGSGQALSTVGRVFDAQGYAVRRGLTGKDETEDQLSAMRAATMGEGSANPNIVQRLGKFELGGGPLSLIPGAAGVSKGLADFQLQTVTDPMTVFGGLEARALRGASAVGRNLLGTFAPEIPKAVQGAKDAAMGFFLHGGDARAKYGFEPYAKTVGETERGKKRGADFAEILNERRAQHVAGMDDAKRLRVYGIAKGDKVRAPQPDEIAAAKAISDDYRTEFISRADPAARTIARGFKVSKPGDRPWFAKTLPAQQYDLTAGVRGRAAARKAAAESKQVEDALAKLGPPKPQPFKSDDDLRQEYLDYIEPQIKAGHITTKQQVDDGLAQFIAQRRAVNPNVGQPKFKAAIDRQAAVTGRAHEMFGNETARQEPFWAALAQFGGKIRRDGDHDFGEVPARLLSDQKYDPKTLQGGGALDEIAQVLQTNYGMHDLTTSEVADFFAHNKPPSMAEMRRRAEADVTAEHGAKAVKETAAAVAAKPKLGAKRTLVARAAPVHETPAWAKPYATETTGAEPTLTRENFRSSYLPQPTKEEIAAADAEKREGKTYNMLQPFDPNARRRQPIGIELRKDTLPQFEEAFTRASKNTGRQIGAAEARTKLKDVLTEDRPELAKLGEVETQGDKTTLGQFAKSLIGKGDEKADLSGGNIGNVLKRATKAVVQYPRAGVVSLTPTHMVNVAGLAALRDPGAIPAGLRTFAKAMRADDSLPGMKRDPAKLREIFRSGIDAGLIGPAGDEKADLFAKLLKYSPVQRAAVGAAGNVAVGEGEDLSAGRGLSSPENMLKNALEGGAVGAGLPHWTKLVNKATWHFDDAMKQAIADRMIAKGADPMVAGRRAAGAMVDYHNVSNATKAAKYVAPFATFRSAIPGAVAQSIARNPARAEAMNRATQGVFLGGSTTGDDGKTTKAYGPAEDVSRMLNPAGLAEYGRAMLGEPYRAAATFAGLSGSKDNPKKPGTTRAANNYFTYGLGVDPRTPDGLRYWINAAAAGAPGAADVLDGIGLGRFGSSSAAANPFDKMLYKFTGVSRRQASQ